MDKIKSIIAYGALAACLATGCSREPDRFDNPEEYSNLDNLLDRMDLIHAKVGEDGRLDRIPQYMVEGQTRAFRVVSSVDQTKPGYIGPFDIVGSENPESWMRSDISDSLRKEALEDLERMKERREIFDKNQGTYSVTFDDAKETALYLFIERESADFYGTNWVPLGHVVTDKNGFVSFEYTTSKEFVGDVTRLVAVHPKTKQIKELNID